MARKAKKDWHARFLHTLRRSRSISDACLVVGIGRTTAYRHKDDDDAFSKEWDQCMEANSDDLEASALKRAIEGYERDVFFQGMKVGTQRVHETALTIYMLKCLRPERFNIDINQQELMSADQAAAAVRVAIEAMKSTVPDQDPDE